LQERVHHDEVEGGVVEVRHVVRRQNRDAPAAAEALAQAIPHQGRGVAQVEPRAFRRHPVGEQGLAAAVVEHGRIPRRG
jgi:hypothetical protein